MQINVLDYFENGSLSFCRHKTAVIDGETRLTFADLERLSKQCAHRIIQKQDVLKAPMAVFLPKTAHAILADLGILYSGNIYTNLDIKSPIQRIKSILQTLEPVLLITSNSLTRLIQALDMEQLPLLMIEDVLSDLTSLPSLDLLARRNTIIDTDPLCIINTSGSTGVPKGVVLSHRGTIDFMDWVMDKLQLGCEGIIGSLSPFYFDIYTLELFYCLAKGATLLIIPEQTAIFPANLVKFLREHLVNFIFWVPTIMVNISNQDLLKDKALSHLKRILFAGEVFPTRHFNYWRKHIPNATFVNLYGPIEITVDCTYYIIDREFTDDEPLPIGFPCRNTDILILNENGQPAAQAELGELCVRGSSLAMGYWNDPEKTSKAFIQNPLNKHYPELIYRTGDMVFRNDRGEIMFAGRRDFQIKHLGYRIELGEIEHSLVSLSEINNACVLYDKKNTEITAFYEARRPISAASIRAKLSQLLPKYMLPTKFYPLETMPRNPNGKIDRQALNMRIDQPMLAPVTSLASVYESIREMKHEASGFLTNYFPVASRIQRWIDHGQLFMMKSKESVLFLRSDRSFFHLSFCTSSYANLENTLAQWTDSLRLQIVCDLIGVQADVDNLEKLFLRLGFRRYSLLRRLTKSMGQADNSGAGDSRVGGAEIGDLDAILTILEASFDPLVDQFPARAEFEDAIQRRQILAARFQESLAGFLYFEKTGKTCIIRYWAIQEGLRNQGIGSALIRALFRECRDVKRCLLWVAAHNEDAIEKYFHYGFAPDGLVDSIVANQKVPR
jgi:D-alanine--poly(phosphoribitol) ligase subunit 1